MRIRKLRSYRNDSRASVVQSDVDGEFLWFSSVDTHPTACPRNICQCGVCTRGARYRFLPRAI